MAISQDTIITVGSGATAKSFGVSKTLDQYTLDDLKTVGDWAYSAYNDNIYNANIFREVWYNNVLINLTNAESSIMLSTMPDNKLYTEGFNLQSEGVFFRNVLVYNEYYDEVDWSHEYIGIGNPNLSRYRIVTDIDLQDLKISINNTDINIYNPTFTTCKLGVNDVMICPVQLIILEDSTVLFNMALPFNGGRGTAGNIYSWLTYKLWGYDDPVIKNYGMASSSDDKLLRNITGVNNPAYYLAPNGVDYELQNGFQNKTFTSADSLVSCDSYEWGGFRFFRYQLNQSNLDAPYIWHAYAGVKFELDGVTYKPIVNNGMITGYTDDMSEESEWDTWENIKDHVTPSVRPTPTPSGSDEDNNDPIPVIGAPYSSGLARYYATTAGSLILSHISQAMGAWNLKDSGKDLYKNIISCKLIKSPAPIPVSGSEPFTVYGVTLQYEGSDITLPVINDNPTASFGSYNIPRKFNDFRDYAPYTKVEIYLPYCGWTVLPSHVVGRSVSVTYYTDIIAATCKAVVYCGSNIVAEAAGVIGLDIPMVTENAGAKAEAVTMGLLAYGKAGLQTALGVGAAVATKGKAGVKQAVSGLGDVVSAYSQTAMAFNQNYTEINGKNGDGCCIAGISAIVIKITRPKYGSNTTAPYVPSEYPHSTGYVSMKSGTVGSFTGLLVADNVDTSGISGATDREKQLIKLYLESGIYVNHPN